MKKQGLEFACRRGCDGDGDGDGMEGGRRDEGMLWEGVKG